VARQINPKRLQSLKIWLNSGREKKPKEIADELKVSAVQVRQWKYQDKWDEIPDEGPRRGAPYRNKNAVGNKGGSAPKGNKNAVTHGNFAKWLPDDVELQEIYQAARDGMSNLDLLHEDILLTFANFIRAQKIMYVKDKDDMTKVIKKESTKEVEYEIQHAWDKQAKALTAQATASRALVSKIKQYEELVRTLPPDEVKEKHRLQVSKLKADIKAVESKAW